MLLEALELPTKMTGALVGGAAIGAITAAVGVAVKATEDWAMELDSIGDVMGGTATDAAALNFVLRKSGTDTGSFTQGLTILSKGLVTFDGKLDTTGKALKNWGIDVKDANGNLKDQTTLIGDISAKYDSFSTQQERVNFLTEVFGKSGANLVDFFDTLASEGGIDAVTKKVEQLGLVLDPDRYEQFNRNLEEMKLVGLGLAVGFTEKLMPAFEAISKWALTEGIPALTAFGSRIGEAFKDGGVLGVADVLLDEFDKIDWGEISTTLINGINSIDWSQAGMDFSSLVTRISESLSGAFEDFDWLELGNSLASGLNNFIGGMFGTDEAGLQAIVQTQLDEISIALTDWANGAPSSLDALDEGFVTAFETMFATIKSTNQTRLAEIQSAFTTWGTDTFNAIDAKLKSIDQAFATWSVGVVAKIVAWGGEMFAQINTSLSNIQASIDAKLAAISEKFQTRATSWIKKAAAAFVENKEILLGAIRTLVDEINKILARIRTSFNLTFSSSALGVNGVASLGGGGSNNFGNPDDDVAGGRASGGPVIKGQSYKVAEFFKPERFTAPMNGRIDGITEPAVTRVMIMNWDELDYSRLATEVVKAEVNR